MPKRLALACLGICITYPALAGLDPVRVGRYSALVPGPSPEQVDPFALPVKTEFPISVQTVGHALDYVLAPSGYGLASMPASCPSLPALLAWPLPAVHRKLGPMRLDEALKTLAGRVHYLVVDPVHRLVSFELREEYQALMGSGAPGMREPATAELFESSSVAPERTAAAGGSKSITALGTYRPERIGPIEAGTELWPIAANLSDTLHASTEQILVGLFQANPESFCYCNLNCLKAGAYLVLPAATDLAKTTPSQARRILHDHFSVWRQHGRSDAVTGATRKEVRTL